jgi:gas vesicle protein GvpL/GvpF
VIPAGSFVYVYGVLPAAEAANATETGVDGRAVRAITHEGLAALVSDVQGDALAAAREVRAHWRVLEEASQHATVLPVRFGTVMEGEDDVRHQLLEHDADRLGGLLRELAGRVQLSVKGDYDEDALLRDVVAGSPSIAALRERVRDKPDAAGYYDRIQLGEMVATGVARRREDDEGSALAQLQPLAVRARAEPPSSSAQAFNLAFLVERDRIEDFGRAVAALGEQVAERMRIRYVGPLPPYSFTDIELSAGSGAWA